MPLNAAARRNLITLVFSNTSSAARSPSAVYDSLSFYFTYRSCNWETSAMNRPTWRHTLAIGALAARDLSYCRSPGKARWSQGSSRVFIDYPTYKRLPLMWSQIPSSYRPHQSPADPQIIPGSPEVVVIFVFEERTTTTFHLPIVRRPPAAAFQLFRRYSLITDAHTSMSTIAAWFLKKLQVSLFRPTSSDNLNCMDGDAQCGHFLTADWHCRTSLIALYDRDGT